MTTAKKAVFLGYNLKIVVGREEMTLSGVGGGGGG